MTLTEILIFSIILFAIELIYFKVADRFNIIDEPNHRSSHATITIRGGGIVFVFAVILFFLFFKFQFSYFLIGLVLISLISFLDDVLTLNNKLRLTVHLLAVFAVILQWNLFELPWYWLLVAVIFLIGTINAYNFMDGINGITGSYSLVTVGTLYFINEQVVNFTSPALLIIVGISLLVFNFFNFRTKAKCFAGDVGSVSIAFILVFFIGQLIIQTENFAYVLLLLFYGLDAATTVFFRKIRKENIFVAHRSHFYQYLANQLKWNHLMISIIYMCVQLLMNYILIFIVQQSIGATILFTVIMAFLFIVVRFLVEGKAYLLGSK
jgi:UDP-N-acetylmuramyl pentapeptide phosphotransferase/UDP-N-acetylglucosamine-1-phosphate transferase